MNGRTRNPDIEGYARQKHGRQRQAPVPRLLPWDGGFPTPGRERTATTVDSVSLPCCPSHCFRSLHHISLLRLEFIKRDNARDLQKMTSKEETEKKSRLRTWRRETPRKPALTPFLHHFDKQPGQIAGGRYVAHRDLHGSGRSDQEAEKQIKSLQYRWYCVVFIHSDSDSCSRYFVSSRGYISIELKTQHEHCEICHKRGHFSE